MYKPLIEDSTEEKANIAMEQWRQSATTAFDASFKEICKISEDLYKSQHVKELISASVVTRMLNKALGKETDINSVIVDLSTGIMLGFKYAMYLHEQRELTVIK